MSKGTIAYHDGEKLVTKEYTINPTAKEIQDNYIKCLKEEAKQGNLRFVTLDMTKCKTGKIKDK